MEPTLATEAAHSPRVIELAIEETVIYELKWRIQITTPVRAVGPWLTNRIHKRKPLQAPKLRPIAKVLPAVRQRKRSDSTENEFKGVTPEELTKHFETLEVSQDPIVVYNCKEVRQQKQEPAEDNKEKEENHDNSTEIRKETPLRVNCKGHHSNKEGHHCILNLKSFLKEYNTNSIPRPITNEDKFQHETDICDCHRDWVRKNLIYKGPHQKLFQCHCSLKMDCVNGEGCHVEGEEIGTTKENSTTDCLEEFLSSLHLTHLVDYLKVLGCMCVRDLRLLEQPELEAIQLVSRRRLLQKLDTLNLHHEAPPGGCSLEAWLAWYGLTHISGFLAAIGVHSVGDMDYLREDDLQLLKPVTRRRIIACNFKKRGENGRHRYNGLIENDYMM